MKKILLLTLASMIFGCGAGSGSSSNFIGSAVNIGQVKANTVSVSAQQTGYVLHSDSFELSNESAKDITFISFDTEFQSSNKFLDRVGIQIYEDGLSVGPISWIPQYYLPYQTISVPVGRVLKAGRKYRFDLYSRPASASTTGNLHGDDTSFENTVVVTSAGNISLPPRVVRVNTGGQLENGLTSTSVFVNSLQSGPQFTAYEEIIDNLVSDQVLYDFIFRFRSGDRGQQTNLNLEGFADFVVNGVVLDRIPVHGNINTTEYKFSFGEMFMRSRASTSVKIILTLNAIPGDVFLVDRLAVGSDNGINYTPTQLGSPIKPQ